MSILILSQFSDIIENELPVGDTDLRYVRDVKTFDLAKAYAAQPFELLVCFGYGRVLPVADPQFEAVRFVNLHTSLLPWGRGLNPNFTSWLNGEPHGVTIHEMDGTYDTGRIIFQKSLELDPSVETLRSSYYRKIFAAIEFLAEKWSIIVTGDYEPMPQPRGNGSLMTLSMLRAYANVLAEYNDRPLEEFLTAVADGRVPRLAI